MIVILRITPSDVHMFRAVRLRALQDTPGAFGATYAAESQLSDSDWLKRVERWNGERGVGFLAMDDGVPCGIAGGFIDEHNNSRAQLISMWTAPEYRRRGVGGQLVKAVRDWARQCNRTVFQLMVTSNNQPALDFYKRLGFSRTGRTEPYPNDPAVVEYEMILPIEG
jgi:ribosomal protein S18 acetylase RimI-like enzyme